MKVFRKIARNYFHQNRIGRKYWNKNLVVILLCIQRHSKTTVVISYYQGSNQKLWRLFEKNTFAMVSSSESTKIKKAKNSEY